MIDSAFAPIAKQNVNRKQIDAAIDVCNKWFTENGYPCSRLSIVTYPSIFNRTLALYSIEPRLHAIRLVAVDSNGKPVEGASVVTRVDLITRVLGMKPDDIFRWTAEGFASLMALGIFEFADVQVRSVSAERVELVLNVKERPTCRVEPGAGITSDGRMYGDVSFLDNNFRGNAQRIRVEWQKRLDSPRAAGCIAFEDMRIGARIPFSYKIRAFRDANSSRGVPATRSIGLRRRSGDDEVTRHGIETPLRYEKDRDGAMLELGYRPGSSNWLLSLNSVAESVQANPSERATPDTSIFQTVLQGSIAHMTRFPIDCPRSGHVLNVESSIGKTFNEAGAMFRNTVVRLAQYVGVGPYASIAAGLNMGIGSDNLPWHEQKSLGGFMNVRGYDYGELGRYKSFGTGRLELRVPLTRGAPPGADPEDDESENDKDGKQSDSSAGKDIDKSATKQKTNSTKGDGQKTSAVQNDKGANAESEDDASVSKHVNEAPASRSGKVISPGLLDSLPAFVGVLFGDIAVSNEETREPIGMSYGVGVRIGGIITMDWTRTMDGRKSRLHFGLVDRSL